MVKIAQSLSSQHVGGGGIASQSVLLAFGA
jgi:hypothetical protein